MARPSQPTGISTEASGNQIIVRWTGNPEPDIKGYNIYNSTTSGGGVSGYVKLNNELITIFSELRNDVKGTTETVQIVGGQRITTIVEDIEEVQIFSYTHSELLDSKTQYYVITAVNNNDEESLMSIEIWDTPLILTTNIVEFPIRSSSDVARTMIDKILERHPDIDVKPGTMTRDIHIDPHSSEFGYLYTYIDFISRSQSFLTLLQIDDPDNTGKSIAISESTYKRNLQLATGLNDTDTQSLIDLAFDKLAGNFQVFRKSAVSSTGEVVFYATIKPLATITIPTGTIVSTSATSAKPAINFQTITQEQILINSIEEYYNPATQRYEVSVPVESIEAGEITNVASNTIVNSTLTELQVTNVMPTRNGQDVESNRSLSNRAILAFTNLDVGTRDGYLRTAIETQYVEDVLVVDAGHPLMQRDYDYTRHMHVFGKVDVFFKGKVSVTHTETFGFLFSGGFRENAQIDSTSDQRVTITNADVTTNSPAYLIQEVINVQKADSYDLTGNYTLYKNAVELVKNTYSMDLETGDIVLNTPLSIGDNVTADYEYKVSVDNENVLAAAAGGEIFVNLDIPLIDSKPVDIFSESIYIYRTSIFSVDPATNILTILPEHIFHTGDIVNVLSTDTLPSPFIESTDYYVIKISSTEIKLASSMTNALAGIGIDIITSGVGSLTIFPSDKIKLVREEDYTMDYTTGKVSFSFASFPTGLFPNDAITADYNYVEEILGEIVVSSAVGDETEISLSHSNIVESFVIEPNGKTINLNERNKINSDIGMSMSDTIRVTYKYRKANQVVLSHQPVDEIVSVTTSDATQLTEDTHYIFHKADDILREGNSIYAVRNLEMVYDPNTNLPQGNLFSFEEQLNVVSTEAKDLSKKGIDINTVVVLSLDKSIIYTVNNDYVLTEPTTPFGYMTIQRALGSTIPDGATINVQYQYGEPITVAYNVNSLIENVQGKIDKKRHLTADVLVKSANQIDVDLEFSVKLKKGANSPSVKNELSTELYAIFNQKQMGERINQSDIIRIIDENVGVDYVILPLTKMVVSDGVHIAYENLPKTTPWTEFATGVSTCYKSPTNVLRYKTLGNASDASKFWRVSQSDEELELVNSIAEVSQGLGRAFISNDGSIYLSTLSNVHPSSYLITVAYNVVGETGANDIVITDLDYLNLKSLIIHTII